MKWKSILRFFLGIPLTLLSFLFIGKIFYDNWEQIVFSLNSIKPELFFTGILFFSAFFAVKAHIWVKILSIRGHNVNYKFTIFDYSLSEIKRYIPGSIFAFVGRVDTHKTVPKKETVKGIGIEAFLLLASSLLVSLPAIYFLINKFFSNFSSHFIVILFLILIAVILTVLLKPKIKKVIVNYLDAFLLFVFAWALYAIACLLILLSLTTFDLSNLLVIGSIFVFSWVCGYLLFVTPMGLGMRELITVFGLSFFMPTAIASAAAIMSRLCMILGELYYLLIVYLFRKIKSKSFFFKLNPYLLIVIAFSIIYFLLFTHFSILKHDNFLTGRFDLGNMDQTVWNTLNGRFFELTNPDGIENISRLGVHSDIFLIFLTPLYVLWESPKTLLAFQTLALSLSGIFIYLISKEITKREFLSIVFAASFYCNYWIQEQNLFDFHAVSIATLFLLSAFYFLLKKKNILFLISLLLAASTKENVFLTISMFGIFFLIKKKWLLGSLFTIIPLAIFCLLVTVFIPNARGEAHFALEGYGYLGSGPFEILKNFIHNPSILINHVFNDSTVYYLKTHFMPTGFLALFSPIYLIFTLPDMAIYLLSSNLGYRSYHYHFGAVIVPFFYISSIYASKFISKFLSIKFKYIAYYLLVVTLLSLYFYSPLPGMKNADKNLEDNPKAQKIVNYLYQIPNDADITASNSLGAHLSHREKIYVVPYATNSATFIALLNDPKMLELVDQNLYDNVITDNELKFYLFKKRFDKSCQNCNP